MVDLLKKMIHGDEPEGHACPHAEGENGELGESPPHDPYLEEGREFCSVSEEEAVLMEHGYVSYVDGKSVEFRSINANDYVEVLRVKRSEIDIGLIRIVYKLKT